MWMLPTPNSSFSRRFTSGGVRRPTAADQPSAINTTSATSAIPTTSVTSATSATLTTSATLATSVNRPFSTSETSVQHNPKTSVIAGPSTIANSLNLNQVQFDYDYDSDDLPDHRSEIDRAINNNQAPNNLQEIQREMELLAAQEQLLLARARVAELQITVNRSSAIVPGARAADEIKKNIRADDVEYLVSSFSGDDDYSVRKWFQDFEDIMQKLNGNEDDRYRMARHLIRDTARIFLRTIRVQSYAELKRSMLERYDRQITSSEVLKKLDKRLRGPNESIMRYITCMQEIAQQSNIPEFELVIKIVTGLRDTSGMLSILGTARSVSDLINLLPMYEQLVDNFKTNTGTVPKNVIKPPPHTTRHSTTPSVSQADANSVRCFNCSQFGHYSNECSKPPRPRGSCFHCGSMDHQKTNCPKIRRHVAAITPSFTDREPSDIDDIASALNIMPLVSVSFEQSNGLYTKSKFLHSLIDTGSPSSFVRLSMLPKDSQVLPEIKSNYFGINNTPIYIHGRLNCRVCLRKQEKNICIYIVKDDVIPSDVLIGRDALDIFEIDLYFRNVITSMKKIIEKWKLNLINNDAKTLFKYGTFGDIEPSRSGRTINNCVDNYCVDLVDTYFSDNVCSISSESSLDKSNNGLEIDHSTLFGVQNNINSDYSIEHDCNIEYDESLFNETFNIEPTLGSSEVNTISELILNNYVNIDRTSVIVPNYEMNIHLSDDIPFYGHPRRLSHSEKNEVNKMIDDMLQQGIIRHSESPYASPIVLVKKKNGQTRLCVDYRALNKKTVRDNYPLPLIDDCIEYLNEKKVFTLLDLKSGFHHVKIASNCSKYTSFVTPCGQYEFLRMPFGLRNAPAVFQRFINHVLKDFIVKREIVVYMDDILIASGDISVHKELLSRVLHCLATNGLELQMNKCQFLFKELEYLGFLISEYGIKPGVKKTEDVRNFPVPTSVHSVHSFIGLCSFFRRFVPRFAQIACPLYKLLRKDATFNFDDNCMIAFETLKNILTSAPVLGIYDPNSETELHTDASKIGYGAVLLQKQSDNKFHPIAYFSKSIGKHEINYHSYELETLAIVYSLGRFRTYLAGIPFTIVTDCNSLVLTFSKKDVNSRIARWVWEFEKFNYKIKHRSGDQMKHADALSRNVNNVSVISSTDLYYQLQVTQNRDPVIKNLKDALETSESPPYEMHNGIVYRKNSENKLLFYVPKEMELQLIQSTHEKIGHFGSSKCFEKIKSRYWFPSMRAKVDSFVKNCIKCIIYSAPNRTSERTLYSIPKKPLPFDTIHIDHFGPLPSVISKQKHILVIIDAFTKFVRVYPATSTSTKEVCRTLEKYFEFYSRPVRLISDRGTCFTSNEFADFIEKHNIQHIKNAVASPQANGQVERVNRILKNMLGKLTEPLQHSDWVKQLKHVEYAINNTLQSSINTSPSMLLFGVNQKGPNVDYLTEFLEDSDLIVNERDLNSIREEALKQIQKSQEESKAYLSKKCRPAKKYSINDYVVIRHINTSVGNKKFEQRYRGPYIIDKILSNDRYVVRDIEGSQITQIPYNNVIEAKNLKLWRK